LPTATGRRPKILHACRKHTQIAALHEKLAKKNEVIAELMEENVRSKKANGEL